jgi:hypothetical protein
MLQGNPTRYALRDLHREIGFFDRKIAHCRTLEKFASDFARAAALEKLVNRRAKLVKSAAAMVSQGVPYDAQDVPESLQPKDARSAKASA